MATINQVISTTNNDHGTGLTTFTSLQSWEDALPANLSTDGNSYVGQCYNDGEFSSGVSFSAHTTDATHTITLTAATGQSFQDHANVRTNALKYDQTKGVGVKVTGNYSYCIDLSGTVDYLTITRIQFKCTSTTSPIWEIVAGISSNIYCKDCILEGDNTPLYEWQGSCYNCIMILTGSSGDGLWIRQTTSIIGCTVVRLTNNSAAGVGITARNYADVTVRSSAFFGFSTAATASGAGVFNAACSNNATELASGLPTGSGNQHNVTFNATTPFTQASNTGTDLKAISSTALASNGFKDSTNASADISGLTRAASPTIGVWELAAAGGSNHNALTLLGVG